ncbi:MAG: HAMP domain-containing protein [Deltaproteobacteria bacterium]|nr:HAMP domain-containing protein [Deltaproteobacteria bacterium]
MKTIARAWLEIFLHVLVLALVAELLALFLVSLTEDALRQDLDRTGQVSALALAITRLGPEKTATFLEFSLPQRSEAWLEDPAGNLVLGQPNPELTWAKRLTLEARKSTQGEVTVWATEPLALARAPVHLNGRKLWLYLAQRQPWRLTKTDHFLPGFVSLTLVCGLFSLWVTRRSARPLWRLSQELRALAQGDLSLRATVEGEGLTSSVAREVNRLANALANREESLVSLATMVARGRPYLKQARLATGLLEQKWRDQELTPDLTNLKTLGAALSQLDRLLGEVALFHRLDFEPRAFRRERLSLSALVFEESLRYQELYGAPALIPRVTSKLYIHGNPELTRLLVSRLLDVTLHQAQGRPLRLELANQRDRVALRLELDCPGLSLEELQDLFWLNPNPQASPNALSLALVKKIADWSQAQVTATRIPDQPEGLRLETLFPTA